MAGAEPGVEDVEERCQGCEDLDGCGEVAHGWYKVVWVVGVSVDRPKESWVLNCRTTASTSWKALVVGFEVRRYTRL